MFCLIWAKFGMRERRVIRRKMREFFFQITAAKSYFVDVSENTVTNVPSDYLAF
jgi:hypothetical protein